MAVSPPSVLELVRAAFRQEADDLLTELDSALLQLEASPGNGDALNRAFRAMHTLKGSGATAGFHEVAAIVHHAEDVFNGARAGRVRISSKIIDLVLQIGDFVRRLLAAPSDEGPRLLEEGMKVVTELDALVAPAASVSLPESLYQAVPKIVEIEPIDGLWAIHFAPAARIFQTGGEPLLLLRELLSLGHGVARASTERLLAEPVIDPTLCYLSWDIQLATNAPLERIQAVFEFVTDESDLRIEPVLPGHAWVLSPEAYFDGATMREFGEEAAEDIAEIEALALALEESPGDAGHRAGLKRTLHNLKGACQLVLSDVKRPPPPRHPLRGMSALCHAAESHLATLLSGASGAVSEDAWGALLETADALRGLLRACEEAREEWPTELLEGLGVVEVANETAPLAPLSGRDGARPMTRSVARQCQEVVEAIDGRTSPGVPPAAADWQGLARVLGTLEKTLAFEGAGGVSAPLHALCDAASAGGVGVADSPAWDDFRARYGDVMRGIEAPFVSVLPAPVQVSFRPKGRTLSLRPSKPVASASRSLRPSRPVASASRSPQAPAAAAMPPRSVRVDQAKLDVLMGAIGELLVAKNALPVLVSRVRASEGQAGKEIKAMVDRIAHIADDLQNAMREIRMMPVRTIFQRFPRMIRDLARSENKQVQLLISGDETELDKTVLEQIGDPLVHLIRNAVDHGIELPADRVAQGKPEMGTVGLEVSKEGSNVVLRISDDGRGMSPERLRAKAVEKGVLTPAAAAELSDKRALDLIFLPGFSTAEKVTDVSGRGVGMDVVMSNIRLIHGTVSVASEVGRGSVMTIKLPSSLMVSKGMLVECASEQYVLPIEGVREMVKVREDQIHQIRDVAMTTIRGSVCTVFSLARLLGLPQVGSGEGVLQGREEASAAIVATPSGTIALVVDRLVAEIDVLVKPLCGGLDKLSLFQGATILGDGRVALILDLRKLDALAGLDDGREQEATLALAAE